MALAFATAGIVLVALLSVLAMPHLQRSLPMFGAALASLRHAPQPAFLADHDPGRELRAEQRARALLRSCVNDEEWAMYRELGFLRVRSTLTEHPGKARRRLIPRRLILRGRIVARAVGGEHLSKASCAYLLYPHKPILAYVPHTGTVLGEYCVEFPDHTRPYGSTRLPDADDVLAKWVALTTEERALIEQTNMHLPGRQIRLADVRSDLARLACWEREHLQSQGRSLPRADSVPAL